MSHLHVAGPTWSSRTLRYKAHTRRIFLPRLRILLVYLSSRAVQPPAWRVPEGEKGTEGKEINYFGVIRTSFTVHW